MVVDVEEGNVRNQYHKSGNRLNQKAAAKASDGYTHTFIKQL